MAENNHFGHLGHSEVSENGHKEFPMPQYLGIDTKITFLAGSEPKLRVWPLHSYKIRRRKGRPGEDICPF